MDYYKYNERVQKQACWAVITIAVDDRVSRLMAESGVLAALGNALLNHAYCYTFNLFITNFVGLMQEFRRTRAWRSVTSQSLEMKSNSRLRTQAS